jgi:hypothetical protein
MTYTFKVVDDRGTWGHVECVGENQRQARRLCTSVLERDLQTGLLPGKFKLKATRPILYRRDRRIAARAFQAR